MRKHVRYNQMVEKKDDYPLQDSHRELKLEEEENGDGVVVPSCVKRPSLDELKDKLAFQEIIVVVEGIDPIISGTFQALQSYMPEDIEWGARFVPCLTSTTAIETTFVDLEKFHKTECAEQARKQREAKNAEETTRDEDMFSSQAKSDLTDKV